MRILFQLTGCGKQASSRERGKAGRGVARRGKAWLGKVYFFEPLEKEISVEDMQKIVDANEKLVKELKNVKN